MPDITITGSDGKFSGYLAKPASGKGPGVLLIQEIFGVNKVMRDLADGFAAQGYVVLCPDLFWRQEPGIQITDKTEAEWQRAFQLYQGFNEAKGVEDLKATLATLRKTEGCSGKVGSVGYCLGGKLAYLQGTRGTADCNVSYYGVGIGAFLSEAGKLRNPLMLHIGESDPWTPLDVRKQLDGVLSGFAHVTSYLYPKTDHAFAREGASTDVPAMRELANGRTLEFLRRHLG